MHGTIEIVAGVFFAGPDQLHRCACAVHRYAHSPALRHLLGDPGRLQRMRFAGRAQRFDGLDALAHHRGNRCDAGPHSLAVDADRAGAAGGDATAELGARHVQHIAQHPQQGAAAIEEPLQPLPG